MAPWKKRSKEKVATLEFISTGVRLHLNIGSVVLFVQFYPERIRFVPLKNF